MIPVALGGKVGAPVRSRGEEDTRVRVTGGPSSPADIRAAAPGFLKEGVITLSEKTNGEKSLAFPKAFHCRLQSTSRCQITHIEGSKRPSRQSALRVNSKIRLKWNTNKSHHHPWTESSFSNLLKMLMRCSNTFTKHVAKRRRLRLLMLAQKARPRN